MNDTPQLFRITVEVADLASANEFYTTLLGIEGRALPGCGRPSIARSLP